MCQIVTKFVFLSRNLVVFGRYVATGYLLLYRDLQCLFAGSEETGLLFCPVYSIFLSTGRVSGGAEGAVDPESRNQ